MDITVTRMVEGDIDAVGLVHQRAFPRQHENRAWIECNFRAYPRMQYFVAEANSRVIGFINWMQRSGFRSEVVLELEQMAVDPDYQGRGVGRMLITTTLPQVNAQLHERGACLKHIVVTTRADNQAQQLYRSTLGVEVEFTVRDLYSADEVYMIARNVEESECYKRMEAK